MSAETSRRAPLVLITGYGRGIGRAVALELARRSVELALFGRSSPAATETLRYLSELGATVRAYDVELSSPESIEHGIDALLEAQGVPDAVINNAATIERLPLEEMTLESWDRQQAVNLRAPFLVVRGLLAAMRRRGSGRFVQVGSIASTLGTARASAYCASKWGLVGFTKSLAEELTCSGLSAVAVLPGSVDTEMLSGSGFSPRMTPEEVARTLCHYALDASVAHNGAVVEMFGV
ncbi:MAG: SDR family oxidoreductase [Polyangiaceae bacterium]